MAKKYLTEEAGEELISFFRDSIRIESMSDEEGNLARMLVEKMKEFGFDEAYIDSAGNAVGRVGNGEKIIHFDSHMDTVQVNDPEDWIVPPFSADIVDGAIYGRGTVDMKSGLCTSLYAAALAKKNGLLEGKTVYVTGSVDEEYCDGVNLKLFYEESGIRPDYCIICEPSNNVITLGHNGKMLAHVHAHGIPAHGSYPDAGINAVYEMNAIVADVEKLNNELKQRENGGSVIVSYIGCETASVYSVPGECDIYVDRRLRPGETVEQAKAEMDKLVEGRRADWEIATTVHNSWTGVELYYEPANGPWKIEKDAPLTVGCNKAYEATFGKKPEYDFWNFGTNGVTPIRMGVMTIGFGPGEYEQAHNTNEHVAVQDVKDACEFYTHLIEEL